MPSGYNILWSETAVFRLNEVFDYLEHRWTNREITKFSAQLERSLDTIAKQPEAFPTSEYFGKTRKCVVNKHQSLFYLFQNNQIIILTIHDNRMKSWGKIKTATGHSQ